MGVAGLPWRSIGHRGMVVYVGASIIDVAQVDRPGLRVVAIEGTTTFRASARTLTWTQPLPVLL